MTIRAKNIEPRALHSSHLDPTLRLGFIPIDIAAARVVSSTAAESWVNSTVATGAGSGMASSANSPSYGVTSTSARLARFTWSSGAATQIQLPGVVVPPDVSTNSSVTFNFIGGFTEGSTDTGATVNVHGTLSTGASGGTGFNVLSIAVATGSTVPSHHTGTLNSSLLASYPNILTFVMGVTSTANKIAVAGAWLTYTRTSTNTT